MVDMQKPEDAALLVRRNRNQACVYKYKDQEFPLRIVYDRSPSEAKMSRWLSKVWEATQVVHAKLKVTTEFRASNRARAGTFSLLEGERVFTCFRMVDKNGEPGFADLTPDYAPKWLLDNLKPIQEKALALIAVAEGVQTSG